jgi:Ala-tRNA(Pro) deacylase
MSQTILQSILHLLDASGAEYRLSHHEPTYTSEQSAAVRGESMRIGGKALVMKIAEAFHLFVLSAELRVDSKAVKKYFGVSKTRFADKNELLELTGLVPGAIPPIGKPVLPFELYADPSVFANDQIAFNAGSLTDSIVMATIDYRDIAQPVVFPFALPSDTQ